MRTVQRQRKKIKIVWMFQEINKKCHSLGRNLINIFALRWKNKLPERRPSNSWLVATLRPGWGIRKQEMSVKQDLMCLRSDWSSGCCLSDTCNLLARIRSPPSTPYGASYGKLQSRTRNWRRWNGFSPMSSRASRPYSVNSCKRRTQS